MKITVDHNKCIGCGVCADIAPGALEMADGKSKPKEKIDQSDTAVVSDAKMAADVCPVQAIKVEEA